MKTSLLKYLSKKPSKKHGSVYPYRKLKQRWVKQHIHEGCYRCGAKLYPAKEAFGDNMATLDHYVPVWFLKAIKLPEGMIHPPNFRVCCLRCNNQRGKDITTVWQLRRDVGDELVDKLMKFTGVYLDDTYQHNQFKVLD